MGKHVKQLSTSDVMVTLIKQQNTHDATEQLKKYLYNTSGAAFQQISEAEEMIILPDFAGKQISQQQLLSYHLQKNHQKENHILNYESLLEGIDAKMKKIIENSSQSFLISNQMINQLIMKLVESSQFITSQRKPISSLSHHVHNKFIVIAKKMQKVKNIEKTLDVMKFWNQTKISSILTIHPQNIHTYDKIQNIFQSFDNIVKLLNEKKHLFANFYNLLHLVAQRKNAIIYKIYQNMLNCVIKYSNQKDLAIKFSQYQFIIVNNLFSQVQTKKHEKIQLLFIQQSFLKMIDFNIQELSSFLLYKYKVSSNIEALKEEEFVAFYDDLIIQFSHYFTNWHKVTTFHIQHQTKFKELFIKHRTLVFQKMLDKIQISLRYSGRLAILGLYRQIKLFNYIRSFIEFGQQWMGKCKSNILKLLEQKQKQEVSDYFKLTNGFLKNCILEQFKPVFSRQKLQYSTDFSKIKNKFNQEILGIYKQAQKFRQSCILNTKTDYSQKKHEKQKYQTLRWQTLDSGLIKYTQKINSNFGLSFFKAITQYQLRQQQLQDCQLNCIYQHLEYVLILLYKMYVPNYMKHGLQNQIFNDLHRNNKINNIKLAISKNAIDDDTIFSVNQLRHIFLDRSNFGPLYDFICSCGNRYQGISGNVNTNLLFQQTQKYETQLTEFSQIFILIANQLYLIVQYIDFLANQNRFRKISFQVTEKIAVLKHVIQGLVLIYFTSYFELTLKKYYRLVVPIFQAIKFQVKKKNETISNLKDYRSKMSQLYQKFNLQRFNKHNIFYMMIYNKQVQYFYKFALDLFSKIQKINDDGRQILKQEPSELNKITGLDKSSAGADSWPALLDFYVEISKERNEKILLQVAQKMMLNFPVQWWKSNLIWYYNDCSSKQKKQFMLKLVNAYLIKLISLPQI